MCAFEVLIESFSIRQLVVPASMKTCCPAPGPGASSLYHHGGMGLSFHQGFKISHQGVAMSSTLKFMCHLPLLKDWYAFHLLA